MLQTPFAAFAAILNKNYFVYSLGSQCLINIFISTAVALSCYIFSDIGFFFCNVIVIDISVAFGMVSACILPHDKSTSFLGYGDLLSPLSA